MSHARPTCSSCKLYRQRACGLTETALLMYSTSVPKSTAGALPEVVVENMFSAYWLWWSIHKRSRPRRSTGLALQVEPFLVDILGRFRVHFDGVANLTLVGTYQYNVPCLRDANWAWSRVWLLKRPASLKYSSKTSGPTNSHGYDYGYVYYSSMFHQSALANRETIRPPLWGLVITWR